MLDNQTGLPLEAPSVEIPEVYARLWLIYFTISNQVSRIHDGICKRIPPSEFVAWSTLTGISISSDDYHLLSDMDEQFCKASNEEMAEYRERKAKEAETK